MYPLLPHPTFSYFMPPSPSGPLSFKDSSSTGPLGSFAASSSLIHHRRSEEDPSLVYLNVYEVPCNRWFVLGSTLSCVQVLGHEYMFVAQGGVMDTSSINARTHSPLMGGLRHSILIGRTQLDQARVHETVQQLKNSVEYTADSYNLFTNNCHHFSDRLCRRLTGSNPIPWWVKYIGIFGIFCCCLLPGDDGHEPNSADHQERINADDDHGDDDEEHHDDGDHNTDDDDDDKEPPYWEILRREMRAMSRPTSTKQQEDQEAAPSGAPAADGAVPSNGSSESSEALFDRAAPSIFCSGGSEDEQTMIRRSFSI